MAYELTFYITLLIPLTTAHVVRWQIHYLSPVSTTRVDGWPVSITHQHGPCLRARVSTSRVDGPCWWPVNSGSGNQALSECSTMKLQDEAVKLFASSQWVEWSLTQLWNTRTVLTNIASIYSLYSTSWVLQSKITLHNFCICFLQCFDTVG